MANNEDWLDKLFALHALMTSTTYQGEREEAERQIVKLLESQGKSWNDLPELLETVRKRRASPSPPPAGDPLTGADLFNGIRAVFRLYLSLEEDEYVACVLWAMHTHVARRFMHTPRLVLRSAVRNCGKTTAIDVLGGIVAYAMRSDNMTAATFFRWTSLGDNLWGPTILIDEVDNLGLFDDAVFRAALNSGHRQGGSIHRTIQNVPQPFKTFAPVALGGIGTVPLPLARRSIVIPLKRDPHAPLHLKRFNSLDAKQIEMFALIKAHLSQWAAGGTFASDPPMPAQLTGGQADNWRPLIAIADACGPAIGELARAVAVRMSELDEDFEILLLRDIRDLFEQQRTDRLASAVIVEHLNLLPHGLWSDWRGKSNTDAPRPITQGIMAKLLTPFGIRPTTIWPLNRRPDSKSSRGYHRAAFEDAWTRYCPEPEADTPTHSSKIIHLGRHTNRHD